MSTALIVDSSGSMGSNDRDNRRLLGSRAYVSASLPTDEVGIVDFDSSAKILSEAVEAGPNRQMLYDRISLIDSSGGTNLGAGLQAGCGVLERAAGATKAAIFLTDGRGSYSGQAQCFADKGWKVYVFGLGSGVDSTLLQQIADDTGGDYKSLSEATNLVCEFQQVRAKIGGGAAQSCEATGLILQGETIQLQPTILGPQLQQATFTNIWQGSDIEMSLTSPSGRTITRSSTASDLVIDVGATFETFTIANPEPGEWRVSLFGADIPDGGEPYAFSTLVIESTGATLTTQASPGNLLGAPVRDVATLTGGSNPTGTVTFALFSDNTCSTQVFTSTNSVSGATATSDWFTPTDPGTYYWTAAYSGDANNNPASSPCGAPNESVTIEAFAAPSPTRTVSRSSRSLTVAAGESLLIRNARVAGNVTVQPGGSLTVIGSKISGGIMADAPAFFSLCGTDVAGPRSGPAVEVTNAEVPVRVGDPANGCDRNRISGPLTLVSNLAVTVGANRVSDATTINDNGPGNTIIKANRVSATLACAGNTPPPTNAGQRNMTAAKTGQCSSL